MTDATGTNPAAQALSLPEELLLALLNEESGYFHQVPGWNLNCAMAGAALAELSLIGRIHQNQRIQIGVDATETGRPLLDPILREIVTEAEPHDARYWVERLAPQSESMISQALAGLVRRQILDLHPGEFYTFTKRHRRGETAPGEDYSAGEFVKAPADHDHLRGRDSGSARRGYHRPRQRLPRVPCDVSDRLRRWKNGLGSSARWT